MNLVSIELIALPFAGKQFELKARIQFHEDRVHVPDKTHIRVGLKRGELMITTYRLEATESRTSLAVLDNITTSEATNLHKELFEARHELVLSGSREITVGVITKPCRVVATFEVRGLIDLYPTQIDGFWSEDIKGNKLALLKREALIYFIAPKLKSRLIEVEAFYE